MSLAYKIKGPKNKPGKFRPLVAIAPVFILLLPFLAMQITDEVAWDLSDFIVAGTLLFCSSLSYELVARKVSTTAYRAAFGLALVAALLMVWINLAVGIIGAEDNPANLMYAGVLAVGVIGALLSRFQPHGMSRTMVATALSQALVAGIALIVSSDSGPSEIVILNAFFISLWVGSALLFLKAMREKTATEQKH